MAPKVIRLAVRLSMLWFWPRVYLERPQSIHQRLSHKVAYYRSLGETCRNLLSLVWFSGILLELTWILPNVIATVMVALCINETRPLCRSIYLVFASINLNKSEYRQQTRRWLIWTRLNPSERVSLYSVGLLTLSILQLSRQFNNLSISLLQSTYFDFYVFNLGMWVTH